MSMNRQKDGLFWSSFFYPSIRTDEDSAEKRLQEKIDWIRQYACQYNGQYFVREMLSLSGIESCEWHEVNNSIPLLTCERVALKFMLETSNFAADFLTEEELTKAQATYERKQYNSAILKQLLTYFFNALRLLHSEPEGSVNKLHNLFTIPLVDEYRRVYIEEAEKSFKPLKRQVDKIASGVNGSCYFHSESLFGEAERLTDTLNSYVTQQFGYDYNAVLHSNRSIHSYLLPSRDQSYMSRRVLQTALLDDPDLWSRNESFNVILFLKQVEERNSIRHACKLLDHIFGNLQKDPHADIVLTRHLPLYMAKYDLHLEALEERTHRFSFERLSAYGDPVLLQNEPLCYPASVPADAEKKLQAGKRLWEAFIGEFAYPHEKERVMQTLRDEVERFARTEPSTEYQHPKKWPREIAILLDRDSFLYEPNSYDRALFTAHFSDFFSSENIWNRVFLKAHALTQLSDDPAVQFACLHKIYLDVIKLLEERFGIRTAHQINDRVREQKYQALKVKLAEFDLHISDNRKEEYTVALLDWDTALQEEYETFPVLEQLGDSIYNLAVAEMLFYNPATDAMGKSLEDMVRAETQIRLSRFHGLDQLYYSVGTSGKYGDIDSGYTSHDSFVIDDSTRTWRLPEKYLADSLEMILGAVCRDLGFEPALRLAKRWLTEAFPEDFPPEIRISEETRHIEQIGEDYWTRILPSPLVYMTPPQSTLWMAAEKALLTVALGTDTPEKRQFITYSHGNAVGDFGRVSWAFYDYLHDGWDALLSKHGEAARKAFEATKKQ